MKKVIQAFLPKFIWSQLIGVHKFVIRLTIRFFNIWGLNISRASDYYSPLPTLSELKKNLNRWSRPSDLIGIKYDIGSMKELLSILKSKYEDEYRQVVSYEKNIKNEFGPGFTAVDATILYFMIRHIKPKKYIEVGSGVSTYYCHLATEKNIKESGSSCDILCIEPSPYKSLYSIPGIKIIKKEVQDVDISFFQNLDEGDILFIDSSHIVKIDGDVPYLFLEIIPRLKKGVIVHIHDIPFPYNTPYPSDQWVLNKSWPYFWNEAMLLQAFLSNNDSYKIMFSAPLLRFNDESFLASNLEEYENVKQNPNTFSSIWIEKIK